MALFEHFSHCQETSPARWRWENFTPDEFSCPCCGEYYHDELTFDAAQRLRDIAGRPLVTNSAHRCPIHNARVGGAPMSLHKLKIALDFSLQGHDRFVLFEQAQQAGFTSFGFYRTFLHMDLRPGRRWYGKGARSLWNG